MYFNIAMQHVFSFHLVKTIVADLVARYHETILAFSIELHMHVQYVEEALLPLQYCV